MILEPDFERRMTNWALYCVGAGRGGGRSRYPAYNLGPPGRRAGATTPVNAIEASETDDAVNALPVLLLRAVRSYWLSSDHVSERAGACRCGVATWYRRVDEGHTEIRRLLAVQRAAKAALASRLPAEKLTDRIRQPSS